MLIYLRVGSQCVDQTDILTFRCLDRTNTSIVCRVYIPYLKSGSLFDKTTLAKCGESSFVCHFRKRVGLVHEL